LHLPAGPAAMISSTLVVAKKTKRYHVLFKRVLALASWTSSNVIINTRGC